MKQHLGLLFVAVSIVIFGYFVKEAAIGMRNSDRTVSVKGLSERTVLADHVTWSLSTQVSGNDMVALYDQLEQKMTTLREFLRENGVTGEEIFDMAPSSEDRSSWYEWEKKKAYMDRFVLTGHLNVVSSNVEKIRKLHLRQSELLRKGVLLESFPNYTYTGLAELKPEMVEEATLNARVVAQKFAKDAGCDLGSIKTARQGQFEVDSDDVLPH